MINEELFIKQCFVFCLSDIITTEFFPKTEKDLHRILYMLRLCRKPGSPFEVRVVKWYLDAEKMSTLAEIFQEINPEVCASNLGSDESLTVCIALYFLLSPFTHKRLNKNANFAYPCFSYCSTKEWNHLIHSFWPFL